MPVHLLGFLKLKSCFQSIAQQNVASLCILPFPCRKVGQKHASYRESISFKRPQRCHLQYPKTKYWLLKVRISSDGWIQSLVHLSPNKKFPAYRVLLEKINSDWIALAITGFHFLKGLDRWKNLVAFKRHNAYGFLLKVIINSYIENEKAFWVNNATNLSPGFSPQEAIPSLIKVSTHSFLLISIM